MVFTQDRTTAGPRVGVMGGSFDPIHCGHLSAAEEAAGRLWLDRLLLVPTNIPPHKPAGTRASAADRFAMVAAAVANHPLIEACDVEIRRPGTSYTIDTLLELQGGLGAGAEITLLIGTDAVRDLPGWRRVADVFEIAAPVVIERPGDVPVDWLRLAGELPDGLGARLRDCVLKLACGVTLSSTEIRSRVAVGDSIDGLVPSAVERYIAEHRLYRAARDERK